MLNYRIYLKDILKAIERIEKSTKDISKDKLKKKSDVWDATLMRLQIIGESIKKLPLELKRKYPDVEWKQISRFRDVIGHAYFSMNENILWDILQETLPRLKKDIKKIYYSKEI